MKNVHLIPTDKSSRLVQGKNLYFYKDGIGKNFIDIDEKFQNIYITSDLEIKDGWVLNTYTNEIYFLKGFYGIQPITKKIILTTDEELQKDGVQAIDDEFLEWLCKNPSCEFVEVVSELNLNGKNGLDRARFIYKIIIPQEEPKQLIGEKVMPLDNNNIEEEEETLEDTAKKFTENLYYKVDDSDEFNGEPLAVYDAFIEGANWQSEKMYNSLSELRNELYDKLPTGDVDAFELLKLIKIHLQKLDDLCGSK